MEKRKVMAGNSSYLNLSEYDPDAEEDTYDDYSYDGYNYWGRRRGRSWY